MEQGFLKVAAVTPKVAVADVTYNTEQMINSLEAAYAKEAKIIVFPELCMTGYTCADLFFQKAMLRAVREELGRLQQATQGNEALVLVGLPWEKEQKLYNVCAVLQDGQILAMIPKTYLPNYGEFQEVRHFTVGSSQVEMIDWDNQKIPFGTNIILRCQEMEELRLACEICEDAWVLNPPSNAHVLAGATVIANLSASNELIGKASHRTALVSTLSARQISAYLYASAGEGESTQDMVFGGHDIIAQNGVILAECKAFGEGAVYTEIDLERLSSERKRTNLFVAQNQPNYTYISFSMPLEETKLTRVIKTLPFVPKEEKECRNRCEEILEIQTRALKKRYEHTGSKAAVIGLSGGLDSTLALLVTVRAFDLLGINREGIHTITMPCFGTTDRTYENACQMAKMFGTSLREIDIRASVQKHFEDIDHAMEQHDVTYENAQARERTQILMDIANKVNGLVIGTGDMSELALGWATYNGDHMSMYGVNAGIPKTLVRYLVSYCAEMTQEESLAKILADVVDTPVSPELLPPIDGEIAQKTEDLVGPYELHDFYLYYMLRFGMEPIKICRLAERAFEGQYEKAEIVKWLKVFYRRFFGQQFKRTCLPDGPKIGSVGLSPRGDLRMPTDGVAKLWLAQIAELE